MRLLLILFVICFFAAPLIMGCKPPGLPCSEDQDCCAPLVCNPWAGRCTKKITPPATVNKLRNRAEDPTAD